MSYSKSDAIVEGNSFFTLGYDYMADFEYHTKYQGGPYTDSDAPTTGFQYTQYGLYIQTIGTFALNAEVMEWYTYRSDFQFRPFQVSPYTQWFIWMRPEERNYGPMDFNIYANTYVELLSFKTKITEN